LLKQKGWAPPLPKRGFLHSPITNERTGQLEADNAPLRAVSCRALDDGERTCFGKLWALL
jgi:hypothetical protein